MAMPSCFRLFEHWRRRAASRADWTAGRTRAITRAIIAMVTSTSISVKPRRRVAGISNRELDWIRVAIG